MRWLIALLLVSVQADRPSLTLRVFPAVSIANNSVGCSTILMTAEIKGVEDERWYCPKVEWELPDGTVATAESDCSPYEKRHECREDQTGCGWTGFRLNPITNQYENKTKECACTITGYPRIWRRRICAPAHPQGEAWSVWVRLSKNKDTLARQELQFFVK